MTDRKIDYEFEKLKLEQDRFKLERRKVEGEAKNAYAMLVLRSLLLLNGGAAIAMLTFVGNQSTAGRIVDIKVWMPAFGAFGGGTFLAVLCAMLAYLAQVLFVEVQNDKPSDVGRRMRKVGIAVAFLSLGAFLFGLYSTIAALS